MIKVLVGYVLYKTNLDIFKKSLLSIKHQLFSKEKFEVQIVILDNDQGTQLPDIKTFSEKHDIPLTLALPSSNIGFGAGHNYIFRQRINLGYFDYYLCINPDGISHPQMVDQLIEFAANKENNGLFESKQFPAEHPKIYSPSDFSTNWCSGCCLLFPQKIYEELNGFDEDFFLYCEDVDISWRAKMAGYHCFTVPSALFHHYVHYSDRDLNQQAVQMAISKYKLAVKYKKIEVIEQQISEINELSQAGMIQPEVIDKVYQYKPQGNLNVTPSPDYVDFSYGGYFSKVRW